MTPTQRTAQDAADEAARLNAIATADAAALAYTAAQVASGLTAYGYEF